MAHVKSGGGKQKNGRDSNPQYLGVKRYGGEFVTAGSIIVRQRGSKFHPGEHAGKGGDDTIYAKIDGHVKFHTRRNRKYISIEPAAA